MPTIPLVEVWAAGSLNAIVKLSAYSWLLTIIIDEIGDAFSLGGRKWWSDSWNRLDAFTQTLAVIGIMMTIGHGYDHDRPGIHNSAGSRTRLHHSRMVLALSPCCFG